MTQDEFEHALDALLPLDVEAEEVDEPIAPPTAMTPEQEKLFLDIVGMGVACGLTDILECWANYERSIGMFVPYHEAPAALRAAEEAMVAFFNANPSGPDATPWTAESLDKLVAYHYNRGVSTST